MSLVQRVFSTARVLMRVQPLRFITTFAGRPNYKINKSEDNLHKSNAEQLIAKVPPIEVDSDFAVCTGGDCSSLGHPVQYIKLAKTVSTPSTCGYCGLRYIMKAHHH